MPYVVEWKGIRMTIERERVTSDGPDFDREINQMLSVVAESGRYGRDPDHDIANKLIDQLPGAVIVEFGGVAGVKDRVY